MKIVALSLLGAAGLLGIIQTVTPAPPNGAYNSAIAGIDMETGQTLIVYRTDNPQLFAVSEVDPQGNPLGGFIYLNGVEHPVIIPK